MADNTTLAPGVGGDTIATDDIAGVKYQRIKVTFGSDGVATDVDAANGLPVVGAFFQATQPVSMAAAPTTPVTGTFFQATQPVSGTFFQATQPVSLATLPVTNAGTFAVQATLAAETTKVIGTINIAASQTVAAVTAITNALPTGANVIGALSANQSVNTAQIAGVAPTLNTGAVTTGTQRVTLATDVILPAVAEIRAATLHITATAAVNTGATATLPAPGAGLFHYITSVQLTKLYSVIGVAAGAGVVITSTNLPGTPAWTTEQAAGAVGTAPRVIDYEPTTPLKSSAANIATTFVAPAQLQTIWRWNISYFTAA